MWRAGLLVVAGCAQLFGLEQPQRSASGDGPPGGGTIQIGGTVTGLEGNGLVLQDDGGDDKSITGDGPFTFDTLVPAGAAYDVEVSQQPSNPSQSCTVANGMGTAVADVSDVQVTCSTASFSIGGSVVGLTNDGLSLHDGATGEDLAVTAGATTFAFSRKAASGTGYSVTIGAQPAGQSCSLFGGSGTVGTGDVTSIVVNCSSNEYIVFGTVSTLSGTVVLEDSNTNPSDSDAVTVNANGGFAFAKPIVSGETYAVSVATQPAYPPASQTCTVSNGAGTAPSVNAVSVACTTNSFTIGGNVTGLTGPGLVLEDNGADDLTVNANGLFTFSTRIASGSTYAVTVKTKPASDTCSVANANGTVHSSSITNVAVTCAYTDPGVKCGSTYCTGSDGCCDPEGTPRCSSFAVCASTFMGCDDSADCNAGQVCCATENATHTKVKSVGCSSACGDTGLNFVLCDPNNVTCPAGTACMPYGVLPGYYACQ